MKKVTIEMEQFGQIEVNEIILDANYKRLKAMPDYIIKEGDFYLNTKTDKFLTKQEIRDLRLKS